MTCRANVKHRSVRLVTLYRSVDVYSMHCQFRKEEGAANSILTKPAWKDVLEFHQLEIKRVPVCASYRFQLLINTNYTAIDKDQQMRTQISFRR